VLLPVPGPRVPIAGSALVCISVAVAGDRPASRAGFLLPLALDAGLFLPPRRVLSPGEERARAFCRSMREGVRGRCFAAASTLEALRGLTCPSLLWHAPDATTGLYAVSGSKGRGTSMPSSVILRSNAEYAVLCILTRSNGVMAPCALDSSTPFRREVAPAEEGRLGRCDGIGADWRESTGVERELASGRGVECGEGPGTGTSVPMPFRASRSSMAAAALREKKQTSGSSA